MEQQMSENRYVLDMSCGNITQMVQVSHHRKTIYSWLSYQRRIVKDFLIKFTKKVPEAPYGS